MDTPPTPSTQNARRLVLNVGPCICDDPARASCATCHVEMAQPPKTTPKARSCPPYPQEAQRNKGKCQPICPPWQLRSDRSPCPPWARSHVRARMPVRRKSNPRVLKCANEEKQRCLGTIPSLAEGTAGIEFASGAEIATAAKLEALEPGAHDAWRGRAQAKTPLRKGIHEGKALPPGGRRKPEAPLRKGEHESTRCNEKESADRHWHAAAKVRAPNRHATASEPEQRQTRDYARKTATGQALHFK